MLKNLVAVLGLIITACIVFPYPSSAVACEGGKSQGEFTAVEDISSLVNFEGLSFNLSNAQLKSVISAYDLKEVKKSEACGVLNIYYYSPKISRIQVIDGKKVNFHVAISDGLITVGVPFIYYGY